MRALCARFVVSPEERLLVLLADHAQGLSGRSRATERLPRSGRPPRAGDVPCGRLLGRAVLHEQPVVEAVQGLAQNVEFAQAE